MDGDRRYNAGEAERIGKLEANILANTHSIDRLTEEMRDLARQLNQGNRTNWAGILAGFAVVVTVVSLIIGGINEDMNRLESMLVRTVESISTHSGDGHPAKVLERIDNLGDHFNQVLALHSESNKLADRVLFERVNSLAVKLDLVYMDIQDTKNSRFSAKDGAALTQHIQREIDAIREQQSKTVQALENRLNVMESGHPKGSIKWSK